LLLDLVEEIMVRRKEEQLNFRTCVVAFHLIDGWNELRCHWPTRLDHKGCVPLVDSSKG
jgi:hypothetical protein